MGKAYNTRGREDKHIILAGRAKKRRLLGRSRHTWEDNIKVDLK
jgi:hypothetical protein